MQALETSRSVVNKSKEGRASMKACHVDMYRKQPHEWHALMKKQAAANAMVAELSSTRKDKVESEDGERKESEVSCMLKIGKGKDGDKGREKLRIVAPSSRPKSRPLDANYGPDDSGKVPAKKKEAVGEPG